MKRYYKWARWSLYALAATDFAMSEYYRWAVEDYGQAGYWLAKATAIFLLGYIAYAPSHNDANERLLSKEK